LFGELPRGLYEPRRRLWPAEEVGLDLADHAVAELDVATPAAFVGGRGRAAGEACGDVIGHHPCRRLREYARLRHGQSGNIAQRIDVRKGSREVRAVDGDPSVDRQARARDDVGHPMDGDADEQVVWKALAACEPGLAADHVEP